MSPSPKFPSFCSMTNHFRDTGHFMGSALSHPKMALNITRSMALYVCLSRVTKSQFSLRFPIRTAIFGLHASLSEVHWMNLRWPWTLEGQRCPMYMLLVFLGPKFHTISLYGRVTNHSLWHFHWNTPEMATDTTRWKVLNICVTSTPSLHFNPFYSTESCFALHAILCAPKDPKMTLNSARPKCPISLLRGSNFTQIHLPTVFKYTGNFETSEPNNL